MESLRTIGIQVNLPVTVSICWRMKLRDMKNREKMLVLSSGNYNFLNGTNCTCNIFATFRPSNFLSEISRMLVLALWKWVIFCLWKEKFLYNEIFGDGSKNQKVLGKKKVGMHTLVSGLLWDWKILSSNFWHRYVLVLG